MSTNLLAGNRTEPWIVQTDSFPLPGACPVVTKNGLAAMAMGARTILRIRTLLHSTAFGAGRYHFAT